MCLSTGLRFFKICHSAELNKTIEAMLPVNPYDDLTVSLWWPHGKGDLDIVNSSEGTCSRGINDECVTVKEA